MSFEGLQPVADPSAGSWIAPRLHGFGGRVHSVVPDGFAAYARILHPAADETGRDIRWSEVCRQTGRTAHALMQWTSIAGVVEHVSTEGRWPRRHPVSRQTQEWQGSEPRVGHAPPSVLAPVLDVLDAVTAPGSDCWSALWEGWGWLHRGAWALLRSDGDPAKPPPPPPGLPDAVLALPRLRHPGRDYLLFRGPLEATLGMGHQISDDWFNPQSPSLLWPGDHSWCLATEIDFDSTLVGGPRELIDAVLGEPRLEAWPIELSDDLTVNGDVINA